MNNNVFSKKVTQIKASPTISITQKANALKREGKDIISLSAGEPDFNTPEFIKKAGIQAIQDNHSHYTNVDGIPELKQAIVNKIKRDNQLEYQTNQVTVGVGAKHCISNLFYALLNEEDEVLIPSPYWVSYPDMAVLAGGKPVIIEGQNDFNVNIDDLTQKINEKSKILVLNSPSNPSGAIYTKDNLMKIADIVRNYPNLWIMSDDIYEKIIWDEQGFMNILNVAPDLKDRTIIINGLSKSHAMTGWRFGYALGDASLIKQMTKIQSQATSNICSITQYAAIAALEGSEEEIKSMTEVFKKRHDYFVGELNKLDGVKCSHSSGTFYAFADFSEVIKKLNLQNDIQLGELLLEKALIAGVPGSAFGMDNYIRFSYATSNQNLEEAISRLQKLLNN